MTKSFSKGTGSIEYHHLLFIDSLFDSLLYRILASPIPKLVVVNKGDLFQGDKFQWKLEEPTKITTSNTSNVVAIIAGTWRNLILLFLRFACL
jgi:50S ribosomal subunit-associated GTPase HflX